jgi:hypothetical protein
MPLPTVDRTHLGPAKGDAYLARNWKFESISLLRRVVQTSGSPTAGPFGMLTLIGGRQLKQPAPAMGSPPDTPLNLASREPRLLAKWILENNPNARVAIITDRDELDKQIERVITEVGEPIKRTNSGRDLMRQVGQATPRLVCSLVHKFGRRDIDTPPGDSLSRE